MGGSVVLDLERPLKWHSLNEGIYIFRRGQAQLFSTLMMQITTCTLSVIHTTECSEYWETNLKCEIFFYFITEKMCVFVHKIKVYDKGSDNSLELFVLQVTASARLLATTYNTILTQTTIHMPPSLTTHA